MISRSEQMTYDCPKIDTSEVYRPTLSYSQRLLVYVQFSSCKGVVILRATISEKAALASSRVDCHQAYFQYQHSTVELLT